MKNRSEIGGLVERVGSLRKGGFQIVSSVFLKKMNTIGIKGITIGILFFVWQIFTLAVINRSILSCGLLFTRK